MALAQRALADESLPAPLRTALGGDLRGALAEYGDQVGDLVEKEVDKLLGGAGNDVKDVKDDARDRIEKGLGGLLPGSKDEPDAEATP